MIKKYKTLLSAIGDLLKGYRFEKKGDTFVLAKDENWAMIDFQKSRNSSAEEIIFTLNIGICSGALRHFANENLTVRPKIENCHWRKRIGILMGSNSDFWFHLNAETVFPTMVAEITEILLNIVLPELERHLKDNQLKEAWLQDCNGGVTELQRYIYLTTLMKLSNDARLPDVIAEFRRIAKGKPFEYSAQLHLVELSRYVERPSLNKNDY